MGDTKAPIRVGFYDIEKTIGKGNFAVVKLARHRLTKTEVAIKIIDKTQLTAADLRRAYREVRVLKKLHHPHIIRLYQVMETKNMLYIVTEYAPQGEIFEHIARHGRLPEPAARRLYWQVVSAVDYCHKRGVVHRDLKAENLLLDGEGCVKLADFGFSTWWSQEATLSTWCGSPPYAAPEVFEGRQYTGPEVDIWSLGVVLYVLVCGALPFDAATLPALRDRVLTARYRVPYFMSAECESLVRKMLVRDASRRFNIEQVKRHRWMQADGPPRLLPAPGHPVISNSSHNKQYLDPGLVPDFPSEPNEQILRLMASLGIDSSRTRESLRQQSYDHHAAIYFLLLERLRQHRPGTQRYGGSSSGGPPAAVRMMSTDSTSCRRTPRRPSTIAEHAMRKMVPGTGSETQGSSQASAAPTASVMASQEYSFWKANRAPHPPGPSQTSSVDEGVADMDSTWDPESMASMSSMAHSSVSSGMAQSATAMSTVPRSRTEWKWPTRGNSGSSAQISSDMSQASGSPRESVSSSGTTLSSWDSAWEPGGLAASLPSCSAPSQAGGADERRSSIVGPETPMSPGPCLTADRLWVPPTHPPGSPTEFRLGRRASDGLVGRGITPFATRLEGGRAGGVATLADKGLARKMDSLDAGDMMEPEGCVGENPDPPLNLLCSPSKRPSLPESWKLLPDNTWVGREVGSPWTPGDPPSSATSTQLHRQLMALRLQRRTGVVDPPDLNSLSEASGAARKSVLRQQSYKLAQQQPVLPPLPGQVTGAQGIPLGLDPSIFRPISEGESSLHAHAEEEEEEEDDDDTNGSRGATGGSWSMTPNDIVWQTLPVTMGDCKLTDSNSSLSRSLSPLLHLAHFQSLQGSPVPFRWGETYQAPTGTNTLHLPQPNPILGHQERMDTSGS